MQAQKKANSYETSGNTVLADDDTQIQGRNMAGQLNSIANNSKQLRNPTAQQIKFLTEQLGIDQIKATNILRKLDLQKAIKFVINQ